MRKIHSKNLTFFLSHSLLTILSKQLKFILFKVWLDKFILMSKSEYKFIFLFHFWKLPILWSSIATGYTLNCKWGCQHFLSLTHTHSHLLTLSFDYAPSSQHFWCFFYTPGLNLPFSSSSYSFSSLHIIFFMQKHKKLL